MEFPILGTVESLEPLSQFQVPRWGIDHHAVTFLP